MTEKPSPSTAEKEYNGRHDSSRRTKNLASGIYAKAGFFFTAQSVYAENAEINGALFCVHRKFKKICMRILTF